MIFLEYIRKRQICAVVLNLLTCGLFVISCSVLGVAFLLHANGLCIVVSLICNFFTLVLMTTPTFRRSAGNLAYILTLIFGALGFFYGLSL